MIAEPMGSYTSGQETLTGAVATRNGRFPIVPYGLHDLDLFRPEMLFQHVADPTGPIPQIGPACKFGLYGRKLSNRITMLREERRCGHGLSTISIQARGASSRIVVVCGGGVPLIRVMGCLSNPCLRNGMSGVHRDPGIGRRGRRFCQASRGRGESSGGTATGILIDA